MLEWNENFISFEQKLMNFVIFLLNFNEILSEFHEELQKVRNILDVWWKLPEKCTENARNFRNRWKFHSSFHYFNPILSQHESAIPSATETVIFLKQRVWPARARAGHTRCLKIIIKFQQKTRYDFGDFRILIRIIDMFFEKAIFIPDVH